MTIALSLSFSLEKHQIMLSKRQYYDL